MNYKGIISVTTLKSVKKMVFISNFIVGSKKGISFAFLF